MIKGITI